MCLPNHEVLQHLTEQIRLRTAGFTVSPNWPEHDVPQVEFGSDSHKELRAQIAGVTRNEGITTIVARHIHQLLQEGIRVAITAGTYGRSLRLRDMFKPHGFKVEILTEPFTIHSPGNDNLKPECLNIVEGSLSSGFTLDVHRLAILSEQELFGEKSRRNSRNKGKSADALFVGFSDLTPGDMVVHADHGIGRYAGLVKLAVDGIENDYLLIEYQGNDKLYVPVQRLHGVQRYVGGSHDSVRLDRLGGTSWEKTKQKVRQNVQELAENLLKLYAARKSHHRDIYPEPDDLFREFEAAFPYDETPDQEKAIEDVIADMTASNTMMDRLVCGDVGYGKTEVAIRAALLAALGGRQVALMVPTTVLAGQHYRTFNERLKNLPVNVGLVSRFVPLKKQKEVLAQLEAGKVDILVGTHRLLSKDVKFRNLGLLIIDEEHRFGVAAKEKLKAIKHDVDVLTLTATPIPRTLNMAISGLRDFSIMATPPMDRLSVRTIVTRPDDNLIRQGIMDELKRGGQVFYIHNRIASLPQVHEYLSKLVPEARIGVGHGQMGEEDLERVMVDFMEGRTNVLLSTAIVESGLDIPRANTMFIDKAHMFGLADLYQLRGRVGRGKVRAYAFLLVPERHKLTDEARMRLDVLQRFTDLGAGFQIASHDLEIRGAGEILGGSQSGHVASVGLELYTDLLEEAVQAAQGEEPHTATVEPELKLPVSAFLPESYISHIGSRLVLYKRFSMATTEEEVWSVLEEIADRYGPPPPEVSALAQVMCIKTMARRAGLETVEMDHEGTRLTLGLGSNPRLTPKGAIQLIGSEVRKWRLTPEMKLSASLVEIGTASLDSPPLERVKDALREMLGIMKETGTIDIG